MKLTQAEIDAMPLEEKLKLSEALWESIYATADELPIPEWHKPLLDESLEQLDVQPEDGSTWDQIKTRLQQHA